VDPRIWIWIGIGTAVSQFLVLSALETAPRKSFSIKVATEWSKTCWRSN